MRSGHPADDVGPGDGAVGDEHDRVALAQQRPGEVAGVVGRLAQEHHGRAGARDDAAQRALGLAVLDEVAELGAQVDGRRPAGRCAACGPG